MLRNEAVIDGDLRRRSGDSGSRGGGLMSHPLVI